MATLFMRPASLASGWKFLIGLWLILLTSRVYFVGVSLYREGLRQCGTEGLTCGSCRLTRPSRRAPRSDQRRQGLVGGQHLRRRRDPARPRRGRPLNLFLGVQTVTNRRNFANYSWNRRTNTQPCGEQ